MIRKIIKKFIPNFILEYRAKYTVNKTRNKFVKMKRYKIFKEIYLNQLWSPEDKKKDHKFYSGTGSYLPELVNDYFSAIEKFFLSLPEKPNVVDLGCGDFTVGSKIRKMCNNYIAIDIYDELINFNKKKYKNLNVDFKVLDITVDKLPSGDVCFVRQVLQHLSNESIMNFIKNIENKYKYLIITEHFPFPSNFIPNKDKPTGFDIRLYDNSAVVLTEPPFNLKVVKDTDLCDGRSAFMVEVLKTKLLQLRD